MLSAPAACGLLCGGRSTERVLIMHGWCMGWTLVLALAVAALVMLACLGRLPLLRHGLITVRLCMCMLMLAGTTRGLHVNGDRGAVGLTAQRAAFSQPGTSSVHGSTQSAAQPRMRDIGFVPQRIKVAKDRQSRCEHPRHKSRPLSSQ